MCAGFALLEAGGVGAKNVVSTCLRNLVDHNSTTYASIIAQFLIINYGRKYIIVLCTSFFHTSALYSVWNHLLLANGLRVRLRLARSLVCWLQLVRTFERARYRVSYFIDQINA